MKTTDTLVICLSDLHTGSTTALFPHYKMLSKGFWEFKHTRYVPSGVQCDLWEHFEQGAKKIATLQKKSRKRLIVVVDGDAIDGDHHGTLQVATRNVLEQKDVHVFIMNWFLKQIGFEKRKGDLLFYVSGTETHVGEIEDQIAEEMNAERPEFTKGVYDFLPLMVNNRLLWFLHHGKSPGTSYNKGDALRNFLKRTYWELSSDKKTVPDAIISGHYHVPVKTSYDYDWNTIHAMILPAWQTKTRYGYRVAPTESNKIGMAVIDISADGRMDFPKPDILEVEDRIVVV